MVAAIATAMSVATVATQWCNGNATATVMGGNGWCNGTATVMTAMEDTMVTQQQRDGDGRCDSNDDKRSDGNMTVMMAMDVPTVTASAMDGTTAKSMEGATATRRRQQRWMAQRQCNGKDVDGRGDGTITLSR